MYSFLAGSVGSFIACTPPPLSWQPVVEILDSGNRLRARLQSCRKRLISNDGL
jgi:hypothetical protein